MARVAQGCAPWVLAWKSHFCSIVFEVFSPKKSAEHVSFVDRVQSFTSSNVTGKNTVFALPQHVTLVALVMCALPASASVLDELISCVHYRILLCLDEDALCSTGTCCRSLCLGDFPGPRNDCGNIEIGGVFARFVQVS